MKTFKEFLLMEEELKDYEGDINISRKNLKEIPKEYRFNEVGEDFDCSDNQLTSLEGSPKKVGGEFYCNYNNLTSLKGAPEKVGGSFSCNDNQLTSLEGAPKEVEFSFDCRDNKLVSLRGISRNIRGGFFCSDNPDLFEVSYILSSNIEGKIYFTENGNDEVSVILNKYKNNPKNLIKMLVELRKIDKRFC